MVHTLRGPGGEDGTKDSSRVESRLLNCTKPCNFAKTSVRTYSGRPHRQILPGFVPSCLLVWEQSKKSQTTMMWITWYITGTTYNGRRERGKLNPTRLPRHLQGCIFRLTCSDPELTEDHVLTSAYVKIFRTVTRNAVNKSVWSKNDCFWLPLNKHTMNIWLSSLRIRAHLSWRTGKHLHVLHVLRTYSTCSYPGY